MPGDEETKDFFFRRQSLVFVPVRHLRKLLMGGSHIFLLEHSEQAMLPGLRVALRLLRTLDGAIDDGHELSPPAERVHGAALDERFQNPLVEEAQVHALRKFKNASIAP